MGEHYFYALKLLRSSLLISVILHNCEVWNALTAQQIRSIESVDNQLLRKALLAPSKTAICLMMLEVRWIPLYYLGKMRRIIYMHALLTGDQNAIAF